jgi:hypothetical protein
VINGWTHTAGSSTFTGAPPGTYLVDYNARVEVTGSAGAIETATFRALYNGAELAGSQNAISITSQVFATVTNSFMFTTVATTDTLAIQGGGSVAATNLIPDTAGQGTTKPSITITISRLN